MTENGIKEAKELLKECDELFYVNFSSEEEEILNGISRLLDELEQYRAIGTVEGYKRALEISKENFRVSMEYKAKVQEFEAIGTIEDFKALKEKEERFDRNIKMFNEIGLEIRNKTIDEFLQNICEKYTEEESKSNYRQYCCNIKQELADIAEQMKAGAE